jgi:dienelactone hydrolase
MPAHSDHSMTLRFGLVVLAGVMLVAVTIDRLGRADEQSVRDALRRTFEKFTAPSAEFDGQFGKYRSPLRFADGMMVTSRDEWRRRRQEILDAWHRRLGPWPALPERPNVKRLESVERDGFTEHHLHIEVLPNGTLSDAYLLVPAGSGPFPAVFVPFYEPQSSIGREAKAIGSYDYGLQLVRRGFVTLSIGTPGGAQSPKADTRELLIRAGVDLHRQPLTLLAYAAAVCHTYLAQMSEVDPQRIGIIGLSYGGKWSIFASCLYDKFACAVWSDPGIVFDETNGSVKYWEPWYLGYEPGTQRNAGIPSAENPRTGLYKAMIEAGDDLVDLHALMAPRPVLVGGGTADPPRNWQALNHLIAVNRLLGYEGRVAMTTRVPHLPTPEALEQELAFLEYWLQRRE